MNVLLRSLRRRVTSFFLLVAVMVVFASWAWAQTLGQATGDFTNAKANKSETPFGRLVADALESQGADAAFVYAGALRAGTIEAGPIERTDLEALFSFGDDGVVVLQLQGSQIRQALERAVSAYPVGSPAFLHCSGMNVVFNIKAPAGKRIMSAQVGNTDLDDATKYNIAMPVSLAEGAAGYFNIWNGAKAKTLSVSLLDCTANYIRDKGQVAPDPNPRIVSQ